MSLTYDIIQDSIMSYCSVLRKKLFLLDQTENELFTIYYFYVSFEQILFYHLLSVAKFWCNNFLYGLGKMGTV